MTLNQALATVNSRSQSGQGDTYYLACGFEPLHLGTLLKAHLLQRLPEAKNVGLHHGVYGDLRGNIESAAQSPATPLLVSKYTFASPDPWPRMTSA